MVELADTGDLKSPAAYAACGFETRSRHWKSLRKRLVAKGRQSARVRLGVVTYGGLVVAGVVAKALMLPVEDCARPL